MMNSAVEGGGGGGGSVSASAARTSSGNEQQHQQQQQAEATAAFSYAAAAAAAEEEDAYYEFLDNEAAAAIASNEYDDEYDEDDAPDSVLLHLVQAYDWNGTLQRIHSHPEEAKAVGVQGRKPLHVACDHDAPADVVKALLKVYPEASTMVGTSNMNPLHITCSSQHASVDVIRVLLQGGIAKQTQMVDVDGKKVEICAVTGVVVVFGFGFSWKGRTNISTSLSFSQVIHHYMLLVVVEHQWMY